MGLVLGAKKEHTYTVDPSRLLRLCERPKRKKRGAESKDNYFFIHFSFSAFTRHLTLTPSHLITWSSVPAHSTEARDRFAYFVAKNAFASLSSGRSVSAFLASTRSFS